MRNFKERNFKTAVTYERVNSETMHRYHINCYDLNGGVCIYHNTNVIDKTAKITKEEAKQRVKNYFKIVFNIDLNFNNK